MSTYIAISNQNFYDLSLYLYGSIEGMGDLLKLNDWLHPDYICRGGEVVNYNPANVTDAAVVNYYNSKKITPINGSRGVFYKESKLPLSFIVRIKNSVQNISISLSGYGSVDIDFGDNSHICNISTSNELKTVDHYMNNEIYSDRVIKVYCSGDIDTLKVSSRDDMVISVVNNTITSNISISGIYSLKDTYFASLLTRVRSLSLQNVKLPNIKGIGDCLFLNEIDMKNCDLTTYQLDEYLIYVCKNYKTRVSANLMISGNSKPSGVYSQPESLQDPKTGMEALWVLVNDENRLWKCDIV